MFTFAPLVPLNLRLFLIPFLQAWIDREELPLFGLETTRYGLITFRRDPWPAGSSPTVVSPYGEVDQAALDAFSLIYPGG